MRLTSKNLQRYLRRNQVEQREDGSYIFAGHRHASAVESAETREPGRQCVRVTPMRAGGSKQSFEQNISTGHVWALKGVAGSGR